MVVLQIQCREHTSHCCVGGDKDAIPDPSLSPQEAAPKYPHQECEGGSKDHPGTLSLEKDSRDDGFKDLTDSTVPWKMCMHIYKIYVVKYIMWY